MHSINKRKVDVWEDEWEKEANVSSKREQPRNKTAVYTPLLEDQHSTLSETCSDLEASLAFLTAKLASLEMSLAEKQAKADDKRQQGVQLLSRSIERAKLSFLERQKGCLVTLHENQQDLDRVVEQDCALSKTLDQLLLLTESSTPSSLDITGPHTRYTDKDTLQMEELMATHNELEHRYMNAKSHADGYKARAQIFEKELQKMNGLPQIIPILKSTTETYDKEIQHHQRSQANLPLSESVKTLARQRIRAPLTAVHQMKKTHQVRQTTLRLKKTYQSLVRQRACQQLLLYAYEFETRLLLFYKHALLAYQQDLQKKPEKVSRQQPYHPQQHQGADIILRIKQLLASYDGSVDYEGMRNDQVVKVIEKQVALEKAWNKKWTEDVNDNLDAIQLLDQSKHDLARTLFGGSASREKLDLKAKSYDDAQWTFKSAINELEMELEALEKEASYHTNDALFQQRRSFVSLFFTDPFLFESNMEDHLNNLVSIRSDR